MGHARGKTAIPLTPFSVKSLIIRISSERIKTGHQFDDYFDSKSRKFLLGTVDSRNNIMDKGVIIRC